ncbi:MAG: hypothetical protein JWN31_903 [Frankiales bacterium]|nr:hypothetical protein [Frankiales bacterium]
MHTATKEIPVIALGLVLLIIGAVVSSLHILFTIGVILLLVGLVLNFVPMGGNRRRVW